MARPLWFIKIIKSLFPHIKLIAKLTHYPIIGKLIDNMLFGDDDMMFLPKDQVIQVNESLSPHGEIVLPSKIVEYFINKANYHWIMSFCICRDSLQCENYPINLGCLFLGEAAMGINPQFGRRVTKEEALEHARRCREAGLIHLIGRNKLDASWLNVSPGNKLLSICNCCPCCCLHRALPYITPQIGRKFTKMPGVSVKVNENCNGCKRCTHGICFVDAIHVVNNYAVINKECRGCGRCAFICPKDAIEVKIDDNQFYEKSVKRIKKLVKVT